MRRMSGTSSNLTLTFTLRAEHQSNPICQENCFARFAGPFDSISHDPEQPYNQAIVTNQSRAYTNLNSVLWLPRFGFAWQPFGSSYSTVLRGGVGIFYDPLPGSLVPTLRANPPLSIRSTLLVTTSHRTRRPVSLRIRPFRIRHLLNGFFAGETLAQIQAKIPQFFAPAFKSLSRELSTHRNIKNGISNYSRPSGQELSLSIGYFGHHGIHVPFYNSSANAWGFGSFPAELCTSPPIPPCADPRFSGVTATAHSRSLELRRSGHFPPASIRSGNHPGQLHVRSCAGRSFKWRCCFSVYLRKLRPNHRTRSIFVGATVRRNTMHATPLMPAMFGNFLLNSCFVAMARSIWSRDGRSLEQSLRGPVFPIQCLTDWKAASSKIIISSVLYMPCQSGQSPTGDRAVPELRFRLLPLPVSRRKSWRTEQHQIREHTSFRLDAKQILMRETYQGR